MEGSAEGGGVTLCFELSMPNRGSWNGGWSGAGNIYAIIKKFPNTKKANARCAALVAKSSWYYRWEDGWGARVSVRVIDSATARAVRRISRGFCGYDWMVASILNHGEIYADHEIPKREEAVA